MAPAAVAVRFASLADAEAIGRIHVESWRAAYARLLPADFLAGLSIAQRQAAWRRQLTAGESAAPVVVVTEGGTVTGFACVSASRDEDASAGTGELQSLYLDPAMWGRGLGRRLHASALAVLREGGCLRATLWVLEGNARARRFYERAGWAEEGAAKVDRIADGPLLREVRYVRALTAP
ncbi:N-acetyltransferase family protein [Saccharomonospora azurea]|uniref:Sortase-like acyltransferase n=1 Tax=Saccharomonospora azurea NA-128 TaxID=882081 RepID=H8GBL0_9PSEU|nr:GNAT family N-acetyltransferase [Saccharomonospora azurea]EHK88143.1 N-acetyltransferase GCN5 [Saccharomonospora azurea SZMC 14600]EHY88694.1 sortase-like acyltransferase [Saccharomonospora azurea NA-128]